jgi:hypothetical protein
MQKWEYCVIGPIKAAAAGGWLGYYPVFFSFTTNITSDQMYALRKENGVSEQAVLAREIAKLGEEGWEMVGCGSVSEGTPSHHCLYFKRPKE